MKAKTVNETIGFERGKTPEEALEVGYEWKNKFIKKFIDWVSKDEQLDKYSDTYLGFVNIGEDLITDPELRKGFLLFTDNWRDWISYMNTLDMELEGEPDVEETVFVSTW